MLVIPPKVDAKLRVGVRTTHALASVLEWLEGSQDILVLSGGTGAGKSIAAAWGFAWMSHRAPISPMGQRRSPAWFDAPGIAALAAWREPETWAAFDSASLVVIDDVGTEDKPGAMAAVLERLCNVSSARAILTTNLSPVRQTHQEGETFFERYGHRLQSRIVGTGRWEVCPEDDMRIASPETPMFPAPQDATAREIAERRRRARAELDEAEEFARTQAERAEQASKALAKIRLLTAEKSVRDADRDRSPDLRRVIAAVHAEGMHERPAWKEVDEP